MPKCMYKDENGILTETFIHKDPRITEIRFTASEYRAFINKYTSTLKKMTDAKAQLEKDLQNQIYLNQNLLRISRERANASRSLTPKKIHTGYLVLSSRQWIEHYPHDLSPEEYQAMPDSFKQTHSFPCTEYRTAHVWKSILQTPYPASLPLSCIQTRIEENDLWETGILDLLGCPQMNSSEINGVYSAFEDTNKQECNGLYRWVYIANYKSGLWEMELYTTQNLIVPEGYRPACC